jgi:hypothetical protein
VITLDVRTPVGRAIHTNGHRGRSFFTTPCSINVFAGVVLLETLDAGGRVDFRAIVTAKEGASPVVVHLEKVAAATAPAAQARTQPKVQPKKPAGGGSRPGRGRSGGAR